MYEKLEKISACGLKDTCDSSNYCDVKTNI